MFIFDKLQNIPSNLEKTTNFIQKIRRMGMFKILLFIHIFFGAVSLLFGLFVLIAKKGSALHKIIGNCYFYCMLTAALVSFPMSYMHTSYFLFIIGVFTSYMLLTGRRYLKKKQISDVKAIDWFLTSSMLLFGIAFILFGFYKILTNDGFGTVLVVFGSISIFFVWQDSQNFRGKSKFKNYWLTMHLQRMIASYIATVTAFLVVNNKILPNVVAWLLPTLLFVPLIVKWTVKYHIKVIDKRMPANIGVIDS